MAALRFDSCRELSRLLLLLPQRLERGEVYNAGLGARFANCCCHGRKGFWKAG